MKLSVVLVRTETSGNIGATARAVANMGCDRLILLDPRCAIDGEAKMMAAGAKDLLDRAIVYQSWEDFYAQEGEGVRIAFSRRGGRKRKVFAFDETLKSVGPEAEHLYLIFGPEKDGLDSPDLAYVNFTCYLPSFGELSSYNLSQAVLLALFMTRQVFPAQSLPDQVKGGTVPSVQPLYFPDALIKQWLEAMGFDVQARRASAYLTLRRLFLQNLPTKHELQVLEAILNQNIRKLKSLALTSEEIRDDVGDVTVKKV